MASKPRQYQKDEPVAIELRCGWRARLLDDARIAEQVERLVAIEAARCRVAVAALTVEVNHVHIVASQDFPGHDPRKRLGLAAFMRNLGSRSARWLNGLLSLQGRLWERSYRSHRRSGAAEVLESLVYTVMNPVKHEAVKRAEDYGFNSTDVYFQCRPDGVVTHLPILFAGVEGSEAARGAYMRKLIIEVWDEWEKGGTLLDAARKALHQHREEIDLRVWKGGIPIADWVGEEAAEKKRKEVASRVPPRAVFQPRRAPRKDEVLAIVVRHADPRPLAGAGWHEWHD